ncbi:MAG: aminoglycoside phosphotransferase family protein [Lunatimonas sp.]|uniref:phosphotransferase enzyme family protein n=1 Tax=Lunatimonas sp. TaxID=2060141 RepID=UPI00263B77F7|nr:aminoglycoside phosphotransferase family protein [Lunatimonas sp.]MCC5935662.1 aminoglycoside phosphotransferase family protein [Lunatimonas sp.]
MEKQIIDQVLTAYPDLRSDASFSRFGSGHIHSTYRLQVGPAAYILQEFNDKVFKYPDRISGNLTVLYSHLKEGMLSFELPLPVQNNEGEMFTSVGGRLFRIFPFVEGITKDKVDELPACRKAAAAFADFIVAFLPVDAATMRDTIPDFHNLALRFEQFEESIRNTRVAITPEVDRLITFYQRQRDLVDTYSMYKKSLPLRVTHNDTKINNLIYQEDLSKVNALIDLDTIMAGYVFYDFGDLVRTVTCSEDESSLNWDSIHVDLAKYEALIAGFFQPLKGLLDAKEMGSLTYGGEMMTCIMGLRFLTDYLNGNVYYHISYENQNLHRSKNQSMLLQSLRDHRAQIQQMVDSIVTA